MRLRTLAALLVLTLARLSAEEPAELPATLSLSQAEELLASNNLTVIAARYGVEGARAARLIATYTPNPTLTVGAEQVTTNRRLNNYSSDVSSGTAPQYTFRIDQMLETGGKKSLRTGAADFTLAANEAQVLDAIRLQTLQLKTTFYTALLARENLVNAQDILESITGTERLMSKLSKEGNIAELDLVKFQANKIQFERDVQTAQVTYQQALRDLATVLAASLPNSKSDGAPSKFELLGTLETPKVDIDIDDLLARLDQRPDLVAAQLNVEAAEKNAALARAQRWSDVTVGGEYQRIGGDNTVGVVVSVPLPLYNNHKGNIQQAEALRDQACNQLKLVRLQARADVDKAYQSYLSNKKIVALYESGVVEKSRKSLEIVRTSYEKKSASLLDLLDAERSFKQTAQSLNQAHFDLLNNISTLESAAGMKLLK